MTYQLKFAGGPSVGEQQRLIPRLRPKPSSGKLRSTTTRSTVTLPTSPHPQPPIFNRQRADLSVPRTSNPNNLPVEMDTAIFTRKEHRPSGLPTPVERSITPIARPRTGPPTKDHRAFSFGTSNKAPSSVGSSGASSDKAFNPEKRAPRAIRKKGSATDSDNAYSLGGSQRKGSITSIYGSTVSLSTSTSSLLGGSRNTSQTSILGITLPATSTTTSQTSLLNMPRQRSGSAPRLITQDLPAPLGSSETAYDSSPSIRYTDSPFSHSSAPSSASSHSPGPSAMLRTISSSPSRPPVTRKRAGSLASVEHNDIGLDPVRESVTSTSSDSTVRADEKTGGDSKGPGSTHPRGPPIPQSRSPFVPTTKPPKLAPSPQLVPSSKASPAGGTPTASRARWGATTSGIPSFPSKEIPGLGVSVPGGTLAPSLVKSRSRSISSSFSQQKTRKDAATPPLPSSALAQPSGQKFLPRAVAHGLTYNTTPPPPQKRSGSQDSAAVNKSPSVSSPPKSVGSAVAKPGFFSRGRTKSEEKAPERSVRRGPTAGTGYEGYGAFGKASRGRSGSASNGGRGRSGSQNSLTSASRSRSGSRPGSRGSVEMDDYFMERLKPVVIVGGEVVDNQNRPTEMIRSGSSPAMMESNPDSRQGKPEAPRCGSSLGVFSRGNSPSALGSDKETVALRRANIAGRAMTPIPAPINISGYKLRPSPSPVSSLAGSVGSSRKQSFDSQDTVTPVLSKPKSKRWNFFQKSQPKSAASLHVPAPSGSPPTVVPVPMIPRSASRRNIPAHYALLDQEEQREAQDLVERMHELRQKRVVSNESLSASLLSANYTHAARKQPSVQFADTVKATSNALPVGKSPNPIPMPLYRDESGLVREKARQVKADERKALRQVENVPQSAPPTITTKPRLPQIRTQISQLGNEQGWSAPPRMGRVVSHMFETPASEGFQINWNSYGLTPTDAPSGLEKSKDFLEYDPLDIRGRRHALATPIEEDTPVSASFQNDIDWPARSDSISTPIVTEASIKYDDDPTEEEEEFWDEHNDLEGLYGFSRQPSPPIMPIPLAPTIKRTDTVKSTTSSLGSPFQYADLCSPLQTKFDSPKVEQEKDVYPLDSPTLPPALPSKSIPDSLPLLSGSSLLGPEQPLPFTPSAQSALAPATPFSISSFIRYYGETDSQRGFSLAEPIHQLDSPERTPPSKTHKSTLSNGSTSTSGSGRSVIAAEDEMRIRPWALLASRWLSFDQVLVSPAHQLLQSGSGGRVLVVDGLGTDDWSYYCALSYPSSKIYNLSQQGTATATKLPGSPSDPRPKNHHQIHYPSFATSLPFPKGFFDVICFRFLPSSSDGHWPFILSECKRVLQPGGYLEATLLDADLMNAGPRAQRAVHLVKAIMQRESPYASSFSSGTKPASDKVLRILQKKGFSDISKCFVGLPAVGKVDLRSQGEREPSPDDPDAIDEVVSKVGRWWYTRCYEGVITAQGEAMGRSMWCDKALLRECKKMGTNFRMMVCCARKPVGRKGSDAAVA